MKSIRFTLGLIFVLLLMPACTTESEIRQDFEAAKRIATKLSLSNSQINILQSLSFGQESRLLSPLISYSYFDSSLTDGNGIQFTLNFGKGTVLADGIKRRGKLEVYASSYPGSSMDSVSIYASSYDSFAILSNTGWNPWMGHISSKKQSPEEYRISESHLDQFASDLFRLNMIMQYTFAKPASPAFSDQNSNNGQCTLGEFSCFLLNCIRTENCFAQFSRGSLHFSDNVQADLNPYGNSNCDFDAVFRRAGNETIYYLW